MTSPKFIEISDCDAGYPIDLLSIPLHYRDDLENVLIPSGLISDRTERMANQIINDYTDQPLVCFCVLKDGYKFCSSLVEKIQSRNRNTTKRSLPMIINFIKSEEETSEDMIQIKGKNVLLIDNIVETGRTIFGLIERIKKHEPASLKCCSLLVKRTNNLCLYVPDYIGFQIPNKYVVGYALDLNEHFRDLEHICQIKETSLHKFKKFEA